MRCTMELLLVILLDLAAAPSDEPQQKAAPADFKLVVTGFEVGDAPTEKAELFGHGGRIYQFRSESSEVVIVDPPVQRVDLLDIDVNHRVQTSLPIRRLDDELEKRRKETVSLIKSLEKDDDRANRISAQMHRDLLEPKLTGSFDASGHRLRLSGGVSEVEATGEPDSDDLRLALIADVMPALVKLDAMRDGASIPPFARLETLSDLIGKHNLRPTELTFLYRLGGPPRKNRWTYRLVTSLTDREREALARVEYLRLKAPKLRFETYEHRAEKAVRDRG